MTSMIDIKKNFPRIDFTERTIIFIVIVLLLNFVARMKRSNPTTPRKLLTKRPP